MRGKRTWKDVFGGAKQGEIVGDDYALRRIRYLARKQVYQSFFFGMLLSAALLLVPVGAQDWFGDLA